jgi:polar amino acid transport system substrate-binding protein
MDVFSAVMGKLGCQFKAEKTPWERTLLNVENGTMLFAAGATVTDERKKFAFFSEPYDVERIMPYVLKKNISTMKLGGIDEILKANYKIVVTAGATFGDEFDGLVKSGKLVKDKNLFEAATEKQAVEMVSLGRADIFLASGSGLKFRDDIADGKKAVFTNETRFMLSKKSTDAAFVADVDKAINSLQKDGTFKRIKAKYFGKK